MWLGMGRQRVRGSQTVHTKPRYRHFAYSKPCSRTNTAIADIFDDFRRFVQGLNFGCFRESDPPKLHTKPDPELLWVAAIIQGVI